MSHAQSSHVYDYFKLDDKNKTYKCIEKKKMWPLGKSRHVKPVYQPETPFKKIPC